MPKILTVECDNVICTSTVKRGSDNAHIKITLQEVRLEELMNSLIKNAGIQAILDNISDTCIETYMKRGK